MGRMSERKGSMPLWSAYTRLEVWQLRPPGFAIVPLDTFSQLLMLSLEGCLSWPSTPSFEICVESSLMPQLLTLYMPVKSSLLGWCWSLLLAKVAVRSMDHGSSNFWEPTWLSVVKWIWGTNSLRGLSPVGLPGTLFLKVWVQFCWFLKCPPSL